MKYLATTIEHLAAFDKESVIEPAPDNPNTSCVTIGRDHYMPFIGWMKYDEESENWVEVDPEDEEKIMNYLSETYHFREISQKEAGEKFSNNVDFVE